MDQDEFDEFLAYITLTTEMEEEMINALIDTEYLPFLVRRDAEDIFKFYDIETPLMVVLGPRGHESAQEVLRDLYPIFMPGDSLGFLPPFSRN
jgi:hypothetical protein